MITLSLIAARARNGVIGKGNTLPWHFPEDLAFFKRTTLGQPVIMGRHTHASIGRALPGRPNWVISSNPERVLAGCAHAPSLDVALTECAAQGYTEAFLIGGAQLYAEGLHKAQKLILTEIDHDFDGDVFFPDFSKSAWQEVEREIHHSALPNDFDYAFVCYKRIHAD
jgi:dihydrofolate reductase